MATLTFQCPGCKQLCAFPERHAGKNARCTRCNQRFIIPPQSNLIPQMIEAPKPRPLKGFYRAALVDSAKLLANPKKSITGIVFICVIVAFRFFLADIDYSFTLGRFRVQMPLGWVAVLITWGCQTWYYMQILLYGSMNIDDMPQMEIGGGFAFLWTCIKSIYLFAVAVILSILPFLLPVGIALRLGWDKLTCSIIIIIGGALLFPMLIFILATDMEPYMVFRIDYILRPLRKAFVPYMPVVGLTIACAFFQMESRSYGQISEPTVIKTSLHLLLNLGSAMLALIAMRATGLFTYYYPL